MYRKANKSDIDDIMKLPNLNKSKEELEDYLNKGYKYLYVYERDNSSIIGASFFGADGVEDDDYDSEVYGIYTRNVKDKDTINAEMLFDTKKELFNLGYRNLIIWCDERNEKKKKYLQSSGGIESRKRENNGRIEVAYTYNLVDLSEMEKDI
ncbi:MAG: hypothetical protein ACI4ON_00600 [Clostridia bacterium]